VELKQVSLQVLWFPLVIVILPLLHTHLSLPFEVGNSPDHAAYNHLSPQLRVSTSDPAIGWSRSKADFSLLSKNESRIIKSSICLSPTSNYLTDWEIFVTFGREMLPFKGT
jgi:hypothetical protein